MALAYITILVSDVDFFYLLHIFPSWDFYVKT